eukprot:6208939-Pleurochrysis_carterae.AAC.2
MALVALRRAFARVRVPVIVAHVATCAHWCTSLCFAQLRESVRLREGDNSSICARLRARSRVRALVLTCAFLILLPPPSGLPRRPFVLARTCLSSVSGRMSRSMSTVSG